MSREQQYTRAEFFRAGASGGADAITRMFRGLFSVRPEAPARPKPAAPLRPPGALLGAEFLAACTGCNDCIVACPHSVIRKAGPEVGETFAGKPVIVPEDNPCRLCDDLPCITACQEGALVPPAEGERITLGVAVVDASRCVQLQGEFCDDCSTYCPEKKARAIVSHGFGELPTVNAEACTGCGECVMVCKPTGAAIKIVPLGHPSS
jgi:ferredoxin-type protein NapG